MYIQKYNEVKRLRKKIYDKQILLINKINEDGIIDYSDLRIINYVGEIRILEEILDYRIEEFKYNTQKYWSNKRSLNNSPYSLNMMDNGIMDKL